MWFHWVFLMSTARQCKQTPFLHLPHFSSSSSSHHFGQQYLHRHKFATFKFQKERNTFKIVWMAHTVSLSCILFRSLFFSSFHHLFKTSHHHLVWPSHSYEEWKKKTFSIFFFYICVACLCLYTRFNFSSLRFIGFRCMYVYAYVMLTYTHTYTRHRFVFSQYFSSFNYCDNMRAHGNNSIRERNSF